MPKWGVWSVQTFQIESNFFRVHNTKVPTRPLNCSCGPESLIKIAKCQICWTEVCKTCHPDGCDYCRVFHCNPYEEDSYCCLHGIGPKFCTFWLTCYLALNLNCTLSLVGHLINPPLKPFSFLFPAPPRKRRDRINGPWVFRLRSGRVFTMSLLLEGDLWILHTWMQLLQLASLRHMSMLCPWD